MTVPGALPVAMTVCLFGPTTTAVRAPPFPLTTTTPLNTLTVFLPFPTATSNTGSFMVILSFLPRVICPFWPGGFVPQNDLPFWMSRSTLGFGGGGRTLTAPTPRTGFVWQNTTFLPTCTVYSTRPFPVAVTTSPA